MIILLIILNLRNEIPNKEIMKEFEKALKDKSFGEVVDIIKSSDKMLKSTLNEDRKILAVAICYNSKKKEHECKIEVIK